MLAEAPPLEVTGILSGDDRVYSLGTDTKVLSTVFELMVNPLLFQLARDNGLVVRQPDKQNYYPDFTLMRDKLDNQKIAVDVKTTYRHFAKNGTWTASFTLGGYTSFMLKNTKNILFPYDQYAKHYIIGFIYTRVETSGSKIFTLRRRKKAERPYKNVDWFVQEKHRIAGERAGSGNTTNIGSIVASSNAEFAKGNGPFAKAGEAVFLDYWRNYAPKAADRKYNNLSEYYKWKAGK
jgi:hypothetical protein